VQWLPRNSGMAPLEYTEAVILKTVSRHILFVERN